VNARAFLLAHVFAMQTAQVRHDLDVLQARWDTAMAVGDDDLAEFVLLERLRIAAEATDYDAYMKSRARMGYVRSQIAPPAHSTWA
jgi:hypothetical protein